MPAVEDPRRHHRLHLARKPSAKHRVIPHRPHQLPHDVEGREVRDEKEDETPHRAQQVAADIRGGMPLQPQPDVRGRVQPRLRNVTRGPVRSPLGRRVRTHVLFCDVEGLGLHDPRAPNEK